MSQTALDMKIKFRALARQLEQNLRQWQQQAVRWLKAQLAKRPRLR